MGNIVTCTKRTYHIQMPNGIKMEVESEKPLSGVTTAKLLEEDSDINSFLENIKILDINISEKKTIHEKSSYKNKPRRKLPMKRIKHEELDLVSKEQEISPEDKTPEKSGNKLPPCDRVNMMITMEGEFTRLDYQKFMEGQGCEMSDFMGHGDIEDAIMLKRIVPTGEKIGRHRKYRITDIIPVEQHMLRKALKNRKEKRKY